MWPLAGPQDKPLSVWDICSQGIRDEETVAKLQRARTSVDEADRKYHQAFKSSEVHNLIPGEFQCKHVGKEDTTWLYNQKLVGGNPKQRDIYDRLKAGASDNLCPFCNHRDVYDLDHFLPKESFHLLAVNPWNLVPSCKECNWNKKAHFTAKASEAFFHPYFGAPQGTWLAAEIHEGIRPSVRFVVDPPSGWSLVEGDRARFQFKELQLDRLYRAQTSRELRVLASTLSGLFKAAGINGAERVRGKLLELATQQENADLNDWKLAMYRAMARSDWYCAGGFGKGAVP